MQERDLTKYFTEQNKVTAGCLPAGRKNILLKYKNKGGS